MKIVRPEIESYAGEHTTPPTPLLEALAAETRATMSTPQMLTGRIEGRLLELLVHASGARRVLEIGTFTGYSALSMAAGLPPGGRIDTCEIDPARAELARRYIAQSPYADRITVHVGPALESIAELEGEFDFVFIDADKPNYVHYIEAVLPRLSEHGLIAVDNTLWDGEVLDPHGRHLPCARGAERSARGGRAHRRRSAHRARRSHADSTQVGAVKPRSGALLLGLAIALGLADSSVVTLALPDMLQEFDVAIAEVAWVLISYNLVLAVAAIPAAYIARRWPRATLAVGLVVFAAASLGVRSRADVRGAAGGAVRTGRRRRGSRGCLARRAPCPGGHRTRRCHDLGEGRGARSGPRPGGRRRAHAGARMGVDLPPAGAARAAADARMRGWPAGERVPVPPAARTSSQTPLCCSPRRR